MGCQNSGRPALLRFCKTWIRCGALKVGFVEDLLQLESIRVAEAEQIERSWNLPGALRRFDAEAGRKKVALMEDLLQLEGIRVSGAEDVDALYKSNRTKLKSPRGPGVHYAPREYLYGCLMCTPGGLGAQFSGPRIRGHIAGSLCTRHEVVTVLQRCVLRFVREK